MSILRKIFSDSAFTAFRSIVSIARGLVVIPLITNLLGAGSYGVWVTILAVVGLLTSTGGIHLHGSLVRYTSQEGTKNQTYSDILFFASGIGIILGALVIILGSTVDFSYLLEGEVTDQITLAIVSALLILSSILFTININFPRAKGYIKFYDFSKLVRMLLEIIVLLTVFLLGGEILSGLAALVGILLAMNVAIMSIMFVKFDFPAPDPNNFRQYLNYGLPMVPKELSSKLLTDADKYLLLYFLGPATVGIYAVARAISQPMVKLTGIFNPTLYPTISQEWDDSNFGEIATVYRTIFRFYSIIGIPAVVGIVILAEPLLKLISTAEIAQEGLILVPIFILGYFLKGYDNSIRYILTSAERTDIIAGSTIITVTLNILLNLLLIPRFGMVGAAFATLSSHFLLFLITLYYSLSLIQLPLPWSTITRSILSTVMMGVFLLFVDRSGGIYYELVCYPIIGIIVYFFVLLLSGEFSKSELENIKKEVKDALI